jgi:exopolysaccharide biosynthesis polyprenyl glycosylphosphotransferase
VLPGLWQAEPPATTACPRLVVPSPAWASWQRVAKRALDITVAATLLVLAAPLMLLIALAIKLDSPGPVIFRQRRVGKDGRLFTFYKFRGMVADAEARLHEVAHLNEVNGPIFKSRRDPRVTRVGRVLRRTSLDELPQLWNVLRGDMSLVGPRPPLPSEVAQYEPWQRDRLLAQGGITGLWQVSGRNLLGFEDMVRLDLEYITRWSLWLDLCILLRTVLVVLTARGAF